jgi:hypothetical protein
MSSLRVALIAAFLAGCAGATTTSAPLAGAQCQELTADLAATHAERRAGLEKQQGAWKAVVPFAVVARYAKGKAEVAGAEERRAELQRELAQRDCRDE